jgi:3-oxoacyl-[acyl-carrier protein] reductase
VVVVHGRNPVRAERVAEDIRMAGGQAIVTVGDLTDDDQAGTACEKVDSLLGGIDILFNNVGGIGRPPQLRGVPDFLGTRSDQWLAEYQANVVSVVRVVQYFLPGMKERGWGRIIQNSSTVGSTPRDSLNEYSCAKAALLNLTVGLAKVLAGTGITVNTVTPGMILTPRELAAEVTFLHRYAWSKGWDYTRPLEELDRMWAADRGVSCGHSGRVEHVAAVVALIASPLGAFINGANIRVDGGESPSTN